MAAVQKRAIRVKHIFKPYNITNETYSLCICAYIRNKRCEGTTQISWARNVEERPGSDVVTEIRSSKIGNY